jgi:hypothetical protein
VAWRPSCHGVGESVNALITGFPKDAPQPPILPPKDGFLFLDRGKFHASFAGDPADRTTDHVPAGPCNSHRRTSGLAWRASVAARPG